ncbi:type II secretion system minor pseudopilin GspI [Sphingorhabdus sp. Alg239-R122]|uniref:type II secretion system minor pseudopilin GspI n=1 Tax=Sphingorhabdus sp. Alg239-R122 TaxID=2305989 RepID=UPI001F077C5F|nr:type II secretion system minor pseudopilin GspI [Sphingorhabdus sp. Alg239-R122]
MSGNSNIRGNGFTLLEVLVALAIFSLAALTLLRMTSASLSQTADLDQRFERQIVAQNLAAEILTDPRAPSLGEANGTVTNFGREFNWTRRAELIGDNDTLVRVDIAVSEGRGSAVTLDVVRPR